MSRRERGDGEARIVVPDPHVSLMVYPGAVGSDRGDGRSRDVGTRLDT